MKIRFVRNEVKRDMQLRRNFHAPFLHGPYFRSVLATQAHLYRKNASAASEHEAELFGIKKGLRSPPRLCDVQAGALCGLRPPADAERGEKKEAQASPGVEKG